MRRGIATTALSPNRVKTMTVLVPYESGFRLEGLDQGCNDLIILPSARGDAAQGPRGRSSSGPFAMQQELDEVGYGRRGSRPELARASLALVQR